MTGIGNDDHIGIQVYGKSVSIIIQFFYTDSIIEIIINRSIEGKEKAQVGFGVGFHIAMTGKIKIDLVDLITVFPFIFLALVS